MFLMVLRNVNFVTKGMGGSENGCYKYTCNTSKGTKWQTDCPEGGLVVMYRLQVNTNAVNHLVLIVVPCRTGDPVKPEYPPGWQRQSIQIVNSL